MQLIRGSEIDSFLRCRLRWNYAWVEGLKPKKVNNKLAFGTLLHKWLETWYTSGLDNGAAWNAMMKLHNDECNFERMDQIELQDMETMLEQVTKGYATKYGTVGEDGQYTVIATELQFAIPLTDDICYTGTIDLIVRDQQGRIWFMDHKTTSSIAKYDKASDMDRQISRYWWALQQLQQGNGQICLNGTWMPPNEMLYPNLFGEIGGFIYNIILKDYPRPPKVLKNGSLSKDKSQNTSLDLYIKALEDLHLEKFRYDVKSLGKDRSLKAFVDSYSDILQFLKENPREFFRRTRAYRHQQEIDAAIQELQLVVEDVERVKNDPLRGHVYRNITKDCSWDCPYMTICKASMDGSNVEFLTEELFTKENVE